MNRDVSYGYLAGALALLGLGLGLSFGAATTAAVESAPRELAGAAAGTNSMMRYIGSIVGAGILGAVLSSDAGVPEIGLFRLIFALLVAAAALGCLSTLFIHRFPPEEAAGREASAVAGAPGIAVSRR
jgi:DHA2 family methylenomycin A resistance protein-like MFS transporter